MLLASKSIAVSCGGALQASYSITYKAVSHRWACGEGRAPIKCVIDVTVQCLGQIVALAYEFPHAKSPKNSFGTP